MGAQTKVITESKMVTVEFGKVEYRLTPADREAIAANPDGPASDDLVELRLTKVLASQVVESAYRNGINPKDGRIWAAWQETLLDEVAVASMPWSQVAWLLGHLRNDSVLIPPRFAQGREALADYLETLKPEPSE